MADWSMDRLEATADDRDAPGPKVVAANIWLALRDRDWDKIGRQPRFLAMFESVLNRSIGPPVQRIEATVEHAHQLDWDGFVADVAADEEKLLTLKRVVEEAEQRRASPQAEVRELPD